MMQLLLILFTVLASSFGYVDVDGNNEHPRVRDAEAKYYEEHHYERDKSHYDSNGKPSWLCNWECQASWTLPPSTGPTSTATAQGTNASSTAESCSTPASRLHLTDAPYENFFYSDCHSASQVVITSPLPDSDLTIIGPRLLAAWPAGNSGIVVFFEPQNGINGTLAISLQNSIITGNSLDPIYETGSSRNPIVGVTGTINFNSSARLTNPILGSVREIRDFTEGPSLLRPEVQDAINFTSGGGSGAMLSRLWLDNVTTSTISFLPLSDGASARFNNRSVDFEAGNYVFNASFDYPQLEQLSAEGVLNTEAQSLISQQPDQTNALSFLSYTTKLLAGAWRFLTYFGRDSMISLLLMDQILSVGNGSATEAVIAAVLERVNKSDGSACHEETIGDYATLLNIEEGIYSTAPQYDYKMIDTDYFLPIVLSDYLVNNPVGRSRASAFLNTIATIDPNNAGLTYQSLALRNAERIMNDTAAFASPNGQIKENLIHLKEGQVVGQWRDSENGLGGGRIPFDVNTALVPAGLRAIASLSEAGLFPTQPDWANTANSFASIWEGSTLKFFEVSIPASEAQSLVSNYVSSANLSIPSHTNLINETINFHALALFDDTNNDNQKEDGKILVMNTDSCFRLFLLNTTNNQTQLSSFLSSVADQILLPFPIGLSTNAGLLVANPAYGGDDPGYVENFTNTAYHGTVIWSWQLSMMAKGLERQLSRCSNFTSPSTSTSSSSSTSSPPSNSQPDISQPLFCTNTLLYNKIKQAYNHLWDLIQQNENQLSSEVWSWIYSNEDERFESTALGSLPSVEGVKPTESNVRQLWSLTFLAVGRNEGFR